MPRNGSGTYILPAGQPVAPGTTIDSTIFNNLVNDLAPTLTASIASDGQTPISASLSMNNHKIINLLAGSSAGDAVRYDQLNSSVAAALAALSASSGSSLIGYLGAPSGAIARTTQARLRDEIMVNDYVTGGSGTDADPWTGWDTAITWSARKTYKFSDGWYSYATSPNFAKDHLKLIGSNGTVVRHTGTGWAMMCDAGSATQLVIGVDIDGIRLESNGSATGGFYQRGCVHSRFKLSFRNVPTTCFEDVSGILNRYDLEHSGLVYGTSITPQRLLNVTRRSPGEDSSANEYYLVAENCSGAGVNLSFCLNSRFIGGTSESNGGGYYIETTSGYNTFENMDFESNSGLDMECRSTNNIFINCLSTGTFQVQGRDNQIVGGTFNRINAWGSDNHFGPLMYSNNGGAFDTSGGVRISKTSCYNANTPAMDADEMPNTMKGLTLGTGGITLDAGSIVGSTGAYASAKVLLKLNNKDNTGTPHTFENVNGNPGNALACGLRLGASSVTSRALNAGGTVNASGADYAEYMRKANGVGTIDKGQIVGITSTGEITDKWSDSIMFMVKSSNPSYVGGDTWAAHLTTPNPNDLEAIEAFNVAFEKERLKQDRIAFCGQVPVNVFDAKPGDYIVPKNNKGLIGHTAMTSPSFEDYLISIGRVVALEPDGRALIIIKTS